jgi:hypothetical protein
VPRWRRLEKSPLPTRSPPPSALRASGSLYLSSPLERRRGRGQGCSSVRPEALAAAVRPPVAGVVVVAAGAGDGETPVGLLLLCSPPPVEWGCSYLRRWNQSSVCNGTLNASVFVHCGCRGLNMYVILGTEPCFFLIFEHQDSPVGCLNRFTKRESPRVKVTSEVSVSWRRRSPSTRSALLSEASLA